jgi:hypothetical protein
MLGSPLVVLLIAIMDIQTKICMLFNLGLALSDPNASTTIMDTGFDGDRTIEITLAPIYSNFI